MQTVMVVEDDKDVSQVIDMVLSDSGYKVYHAPLHLPIVDIVDQVKPDIVLMDVNLPHESGLVKTNKIKSNPHLAQTKVLLISSQPNLDQLVLVSGADGYIAKPFMIDQLIDVVTKSV